MNVEFIDKSRHMFNIDKSVNGGILLMKVCEYLNIPTSPQFGLSYYISGKKGVQWINEDKPLETQIYDQDNVFYFRIRFYTPRLPCGLDNENIIEQFYLQTWKDIETNGFTIPISGINLLASYMLQAYLGDFESDNGYLSKLEELKSTFAQAQNVDETETVKLYKTHKSMSPQKAKLEVFKYLMTLPLYGVKLHNALNEKGDEIQVGITPEAEVCLVKDNMITEIMLSKPKVEYTRKFPRFGFKKCEKGYDVILKYKNRKIKTSSKAVQDLTDQHRFLVSLTPLASGGTQ